MTSTRTATTTPWDFVTFPLTDYLEEVRCPETGAITVQVVRALRLHRRSAEHAHRVLGPALPGVYGGHDSQVYSLGGVLWTLVPGRIWTVVWRGRSRRLWGFWRDGQWVDWRSYVYGRAA